MIKTIFISLITLLVCFNTCNSGVTPKPKLNLDAIDKWGALGTAIAKASVDQKIDAVVGVIAALGKAIPNLGPISTIVSGILSIFIKQPSELEAVKAKLTQMDSHLFAIENKIDDLAKLVVQTATVSTYKEHFDKIYIIKDSYERYVSTPTDSNKKSLIGDCNKNKPLEFINYADREIRGSTPLSVIGVMKEGYNLKNFKHWAKVLVSSLTQAMFLHSVCMGVQHANAADVKKTMNGDIKHFNAISNNLGKVYHDGVNNIINNFFKDQAKKDVRDYAQAHQSESHENFAKNLFDILAQKYDWRYWFVASYSGKVSGFKEHTVAGDGMPWVYYWFRDLERSVYISSTNNGENFHQKLQNCVTSHKSEMQRTYITSAHFPSDIFDVTRKCLGNYNGLGVVHFGNDLRTYSHLNQGAFVNVDFAATLASRVIYKNSYSVFAIAPELHH